MEEHREAFRKILDRHVSVPAEKAEGDGNTTGGGLGKGLQDIKPHIQETRDSLLSAEGARERKKRRMIEQFTLMENLDLDTMLDFSKNVYLEKEYYLARDLYMKILELYPDCSDAQFFLKRIEAHLGRAE